LADLNTDISKTIAVRHIHLIKDHETPYDRLVALKKFLCPTNATRRRELADKYTALKTAPQTAKKVKQWLSDWVYITAQGKSIKLPETEGNRPQEDFLVACKALDQEYATSCLREIFKHEAQGTTAEMSSLGTYVAEMTTYLRRTKPHSTGLAVSAAELGIAQSNKSQPTRNRGQGHRDGARPPPTCICRKEHWYADCFILNTRHPRRPKNYQPAADVARKVEEARRDPRINADIKTALKRFAARQRQSTRSLRIDNGKPPADTNTFVVTTAGPSLTCYDNDRDDRDDHDYREDLDEVITIDSGTETTGALTVLAMEDTNQTELLN
jgi:hypothetical protein